MNPESSGTSFLDVVKRKLAMMTKDTNIQPKKPSSVSPNHQPSVLAMIQALST